MFKALITRLWFICKIITVSSLCIFFCSIFFMPLRTAIILNLEVQAYIITAFMFFHIHLLITYLNMSNRKVVSDSTGGMSLNNNTQSNMFDNINNSNTSSPNYMIDPSYSYMSQNIHNHTSTSVFNSSNNSWDR